MTEYTWQVVGKGSPPPDDADEHQWTLGPTMGPVTLESLMGAPDSDGREMFKINNLCKYNGSAGR